MCLARVKSLSRNFLALWIKTAFIQRIGTRTTVGSRQHWAPLNYLAFSSNSEIHWAPRLLSGGQFPHLVFLNGRLLASLLPDFPWPSNSLGIVSPRPFSKGLPSVKEEVWSRGEETEKAKSTQKNDRGTPKYSLSWILIFQVADSLLPRLLLLFIPGYSSRSLSDTDIRGQLLEAHLACLLEKLTNQIETHVQVDHIWDQNFRWISKCHHLVSCSWFLPLWFSKVIKIWLLSEFGVPHRLCLSKEQMAIRQPQGTATFINTRQFQSNHILIRWLRGRRDGRKCEDQS